MPTDLILQDLGNLEVLKLAAQQGRILVTHDRKTMPSQFAEFIASYPQDLVYSAQFANKP